MARKRMISPDIWESDDFSEMDFLARLLFIGMISNADDFGKGKANPKLLKSKVFPYDEGISTDDINGCLRSIATHTSTVFYQNEGTAYYQLTTWEKWQTVNRPSPSKIPNHDAPGSVRCREYHSDESNGEFIEDSLNTHIQFTDQDKKKEKEKIKGREDNNNCPEQSTGQQLWTVPLNHLGENLSESPDAETVFVITLPLIGGEEHGVTQADVDTWSELYPAVDVMQDLREMKGWLLSNPKKRKTKNGINRFITNWLSKTQNRGGNQRVVTAGNRGMTTSEYMQATAGWYE